MDRIFCKLLASLLLVLPSSLHARSIQFDCSTESGSYRGTQSPAHARGDLDAGQDKWNAVQGDRGFALEYADGSAATGVEIDFGAQASNLAAIDWSVAPGEFSFSSGSGVLNSALMKDELFVGGNLNIGVRVKGLPQGRYRIYSLVREPTTLTRSYTMGIGVTEGDAVIFDTDGVAQVPEMRLASVGPTTVTSTWREGEHYAVLPVDVRSEDDWIFIVVDAQNSQFSIFSGIQIVRTDVHHVKADAPPGGDGTSWDTAFRDLNDAISNAVVGDEIWVAAGVYHPSSSNDADDSFFPVQDIPIYGGFTGTETERSQRNPDPLTNGTILCGDNNEDSAPGDTTNIDDNAHHVVNCQEDLIVLDGFTIREGYADGFAPFLSDGGGIFFQGTDPILRNLHIIGNHSTTNGGGVAGLFPAGVTLSNVIFEANSADSNGGGLYLHNSGSALVVQCRFLGNSAREGGGIHNVDCLTRIHNTSFNGNKSILQGGAIFNEADNLELESVSVVGNTSREIGDGSTGGGGLWAVDTLSPPNARPRIRNSIFWHNSAEGPGRSDFTKQTGEIFSTASSHNLVQNGMLNIPGTLTVDPLFVDADGPDDLAGNFDDDLRLTVDSPAVNLANDSFLPADLADLDLDRQTDEPLPFDLSGGPRQRDNGLDIGAYETIPGIIYVSQAASPPATENGRSWASAFRDLQDGLAEFDAGDEIWIAAGTYLPSTSGDVTASFCLPERAAIYGGFSGTETMRSQRNPNPATNGTVLSGDYNGDDLPDFSRHSENAEKVLTTQAGVESSATLEGFTICGANSSNEGGGLDAEDFQVTLRNLRFIANQATSGSALSLTRGSSSRLEALTFEANLGTSGPAVSLDESSECLFENVTFTRNESQSGPAGLRAVSSNELSFSQCLFEENIGGNMFGGGGCRFQNCHDLLFDQVNFLANRANDAGGIHYENGRNFTVRDCLFEGNIARSSGSTGGAIFCRVAGGIQIEDTAFLSNQAGSEGGAMACHFSLTIIPLDQVLITGGRFVGNSCTTSGGAVSVREFNLIMNDVEVRDNDSGQGGGIKMSGGDILEINSCSFLENEATLQFSSGGGGGVAIDRVLDSKITGSRFEKNISAGNGGAVTITNFDESLFTTRDCIFHENSAQSGGGLHLNGADLDVVSCRFTGNSANAMNFFDVSGGGAIFSDSADQTRLVNSLFHGNSSIGVGGALFLGHLSSESINCSFSANHAPDGGAIFTESDNDLFINCSFGANTSAAGSSAIARDEAGTATIQNTIMWGNLADGVPRQIGSNITLNMDSANNIIQGVFSASDPLFINPADGLLQLDAGSPAINTGNGTFLPNDDFDLDEDGNLGEKNPHDLAGNPRFDIVYGNGFIDMGAYEFGVGDVDADGIPDGYEAQHTSPTSAVNLDPRSDDDLDTITAAEEFFYGLDPSISNQGQGAEVRFVMVNNVPYLALEYRRNSLASEYLTATVKRSTDLTNWTSIGVAPVSAIPAGPDTTLLTFRSLFPVLPGGPEDEYLRLEIGVLGE